MAPLDFNAPTAEEKAEIRRRKAAITRRVRREVLAELGLDKLPEQGERTLITGAQGTGKSRTCAETIAELPRRDLSIWWLVPTLEKAEEQVAEYNRLRTTDSMPARVVRGRGALDPRTSDAEAMCPRHRVVNRAAAMGVNVQKEICDNGCALRSSCGFQRQATALREDPTGLFVMASDYLWLPCPAPRPDLVIVDESVIDKATETVSFDPSRIVDDDKWAGGDLEEAMEPPAARPAGPRGRSRASGPRARVPARAATSPSRPCVKAHHASRHARGSAAGARRPHERQAPSPTSSMPSRRGRS